MKRWPLLASFVLFVVLCASAAYWAMQLFKPPVRPVAPPPQQAKADVNLDAAANLFGGRPAAVAVASNFQLKGVVVALNGHDSVAILSADGKPAQAIAIDAEVVPGVTVKEVHPQYVLLSEGGLSKRVELPDSAKSQSNVAVSSPPQAQAAPPMPQPGTAPQMVPPPPPNFGVPSPAQPTTVVVPPPAMRGQQGGAPNTQ